MSQERIDINVKMSVTPSQAVALRAFFKCWNSLASMGASRMVSFFVDGDGNFKPNCEVTFLEEHEHLNIPDDIMEFIESEAMIVGRAGASETSKDIKFDFDPVAWKMRNFRNNSFILSIEKVRELLKRPDFTIESGYYLGYCAGNSLHISGQRPITLPFVVNGFHPELTGCAPIWCRAVTDGDHSWVSVTLQKYDKDNAVYIPYDWEMKKEINTELFLNGKVPHQILEETL